MIPLPCLTGKVYFLGSINESNAAPDGYYCYLLDESWFASEVYKTCPLHRFSRGKEILILSIHYLNNLKFSGLMLSCKLRVFET